MDFNSSNTIGKRGEHLTKQYLNNNGWLTVDTAGHKLFQQIDIDMVIEKNGTVYTVDVKTDRHVSKNFFIETVSNDTKNTLGCIYVTKADYWFYYFEDSDECFIFKPADMIKHIEENNFRKVSHATSIAGREVYKSHGVLVPINTAPITQKIKLKHGL